MRALILHDNTVSSSSLYFTANTQKRAQPIPLVYNANGSALTKVHLYVVKQGTVTGYAMTVRIETDSSGLPSGTLAGGDETTGTKATITDPTINAVNTFTLTKTDWVPTANTLYWIVVSTDTADGSNGLGVSQMADAWDAWSYYYNGSAWSCPTASAHLVYQVEYADGTRIGPAFNGTSYDTMYGSTRMLRVSFRVSQLMALTGLKLIIRATGTAPSTFRARLYQNTSVVGTDTPIATYTTSQFSTHAGTGSQSYTILWFDKPYWLRPDVPYHIVLDTNGQGDSSNYWRIYYESAPTNTQIHTQGYLSQLWYSTNSGSTWTQNTDISPVAFLMLSHVGPSCGMEPSQESTVIRNGTYALKLNWPYTGMGDYPVLIPVTASTAITIAVYLKSSGTVTNQPQLYCPAQLNISETTTTASGVNSSTWTQVSLGPVTPNATGLLLLFVRVRDQNVSIYVDDWSFS